MLAFKPSKIVQMSRKNQEAYRLCKR